MLTNPFRKKVVLSALCAAAAFVPFSAAAETGHAPDWTDSALWFGRGATRPDRMDVFYLLPTCVSAWQDAGGDTRFNADPRQAGHREAWRLSALLADSLFAQGANLFVPYYRQAVFEALDGERAQEALALARADALGAFDYYMERLNQGRPFLLAGYSQGGKWVTEILKHMADTAYSRLVAAYVIGYGITPADTATQPGHRLSHVRLAQDSTSAGVTVCFNSVTDPAALSPLLCAGNIACVNPVSWTTGPEPATLLPAGAAAEADDPRFPYATAAAATGGDAAVTVRVDTARHALVVSGVDPARYALPALRWLLPEGNLHLQELFFYGKYLRRDTERRAASFREKRDGKTRERE